MGPIGGNSYGFAYARARDGVEVEELEAALLAEVDALLRGRSTEVELRRGKAQYERNWLHELARIDSRADALGEYATLLGDPALDQYQAERSQHCRGGRNRRGRAPPAWPRSTGHFIYRKDQP